MTEIINIWLIAKIFAIFGLSLYLIFAFVVIKQVKLMLRTLDVSFEKPILLISYIHFVFAVFVLLLAIVIL